MYIYNSHECLAVRTCRLECTAVHGAMSVQLYITAPIAKESVYNLVISLSIPQYHHDPKLW